MPLVSQLHDTQNMLPQRWSHLARHGLLGSTLLGIAAAPAAADPCSDIADSSIGLVFGIDVSPRVRVFGGIEGRRCVSTNAELMLRLEVGGGAPRLLVGGRVRPFEKPDQNSDIEDLGLETGVVLDTQARLGVHIAGTYGSHLAYLAAQGLVFVLGAPQPPRINVLAGLAPWTPTKDRAVAGRPLVERGCIVRPALRFLPAQACAEDRAVRDHYASSAQVELSSVWTFLRLAAELAAVGAPASLISAALDAADDEVRHAESCAAVAWASLVALPMHAARPRFSSVSPHAIAVLATEAWTEGCLNEAAAAEEAQLTASEACGAMRTMLASIARDEARHAELSWAVLAWLYEIAPATTKAALDRARPLQAVPHEPTDPALLRRGVPTAAIAAAARAFSIATAGDRFAALIA